MNKTSSKSKLIAIALLIVFFGLLIFLEQVIAPTDRMNMLLVCLQMGSIFALVAVSMNLLNGFTGLFSLGHAGFMLIGAYMYAIFAIPFEDRGLVYRYFDYVVTTSFPEIFAYHMGRFPGMILGVIFTIILAGLVTALIAFLVGLPVLRFKSDYLAIATLGFAEIIRTILMWRGLGPVANAGNPLRLFTRVGDLTVTFDGGYTTHSVATFTLAFFAAVGIFIVVLLVNSSYGRAFKAIREDEIAAEAMGINLFKHKQMSFCISAFFAGTGGALLAIFQNTVTANTFRAAMTYEFLLIIVLGGIGSITGSVLGAMLYVFASQWWLRGLDSGVFLGIESALFRPGFRLVILSVIIMCVVLFFRRGLMGDKELPYHTSKWWAWIKKMIAKLREPRSPSNPKPEAGGTDA